MHRLLLPLSFMVRFVSCGGGEEVAHAPGPGFDGGQGADDAAQGDSATGTDSAPWESGQSDGPQQGLEASPDALDAPFDAPEEAAPVDCQTYRTRHDLSSPPESASWRWGGRLRLSGPARAQSVVYRRGLHAARAVECLGKRRSGYDRLCEKRGTD
ncbi:MAG TPA: hypothetical protein PLV85_04855 [Polyangiaceae bacterium]|nr:hypothetical protein [Polyangiaceae bacterium]